MKTSSALLIKKLDRERRGFFVYVIFLMVSSWHFHEINPLAYIAKNFFFGNRVDFLLILSEALKSEKWTAFLSI